MIKRAVSVHELLSKKFEDMKFQGKWYDLVGHPEVAGVWLIWGSSGNGKTDFAIQLGKYLTAYSRVIYNSIEEGVSKSLQTAIRRHKMREVGSSFAIVSEGIETLKRRLAKRRSAGIVIIDSFQHADLNKVRYLDLKKEFPTKLFIFISHAEGKQPAGRSAKFAKYDADVKIHIEGYRAFAVSRYGGGKPMDIWAQGAKEYWNELI